MLQYERSDSNGRLVKVCFETDEMGKLIRIKRTTAINPTTNHKEIYEMDHEHFKRIINEEVECLHKKMLSETQKIGELNALMRT